MATIEGDWVRSPLGFSFALALTLLVALLIGLSLTYGSTSRLVPLVIAVPTLVALALVTVSQVSEPVHQLVERFNTTPLSVGSDLFEGDSVFKESGVTRGLGWTLGFTLAAFLLGFVLVIPFFVFTYLVVEGEHTRRRSAAIAIGTTAIISGLFEIVFATPLYVGLLPDLVLEALFS